MPQLSRMHIVDVQEDMHTRAKTQQYVGAGTETRCRRKGNHVAKSKKRSAGHARICGGTATDQ